MYDNRQAESQIGNTLYVVKLELLDKGKESKVETYNPNSNLWLVLSERDGERRVELSTES